MRRWWPLGAVTGAVMLLAAVGVLPEWPGLAHQVALPPFDLLADVRVIMRDATSPLACAAGIVLAIAARACVLALLLGWSARRVGFAARFYSAAAVPALLAAGLDFAGRAVLYALVLGAGLAVTLVTFFVLAPVPWTGAEQLRRALGCAFRNRLRLGLTLPYVVALAVLTSLVPVDGGAAAVAIVPVSAVLTAIAGTRLAMPARRINARALVAGLGALALVLALVVVLASPSETEPRPPRRMPGSLFLVAGVDTASGNGAMFQLDPRDLGFTCEQVFYFSYAGVGDGARRHAARCAIRTGAPYRKTDTSRPLSELSATFVEQLEALEPPVVVIAHSQGAWIAWSALARERSPAVSDLVLLAPFDETLTAYPPSGRNGAGAVGGATVRALTDLGRQLGFSEFDPDGPLARALQGTAGGAQAVFARPLPSRIRILAVLSRFDLPLVPGDAPRGALETCPAWVLHGGLPTASSVMPSVASFLAGRTPEECAGWVRALARPAAAFGSPPPRP